MLNFQVTRFGTELKHTGKDELRVLSVSSNQAFSVRFVSGDRLFYHYVEALIKRGNPKSGVLIMRCGYDCGVDQAGTDQFFCVREEFEGVILFQLSGYGVGYRYQLSAAD